MFKPFKTLLIAGSLALGFSTLSTAPAYAAGNGSLTFGAADFSITIGKGVQRNRQWAPRRNFRRHNVCNPRRALRKAYRRGLNRPHIHRVNRNRIVVAGWSRGERVMLGMGRHRSCPVKFVRNPGNRRSGFRAGR